MIHAIFKQAEAGLRQLETDNIGNAVLATADFLQDDLNALQEELKNRNMRLGKLAGSGSMALVFDLENLDGQKVDSALIRIEHAGSTHIIDNPAAIKPIAQFTVEGFEANVVPKGEIFASKGEALTAEKLDRIKASLAVLHAQGKLPELHDINPTQFVNLPGHSVPVYSDINGLAGNGGVKQFAESNHIPITEILGKKANESDVAELSAAQSRLHADVLKEIAEKGIDVSPHSQWRTRGGGASHQVRYR